jgi:CspA family cold shock protein
MNGKVKFYKQDKAYGFIIVEGTNEEIFFHKSGLQDEVAQGDIVSFEVEDSKKGKIAVNISK